MVNNETLKLKIKALLRDRVSCESNAESTQSHRINTPTNSDAYIQSEASVDTKRGRVYRFWAFRILAFCRGAWPIRARTHCKTRRHISERATVLLSPDWESSYKHHDPISEWKNDISELLSPDSLAEEQGMLGAKATASQSVFPQF